MLEKAKELHNIRAFRYNRPKYVVEDTDTYNRILSVLTMARITIE
ncbi:hypothetical protein [Clostridium butyricum]